MEIREARPADVAGIRRVAERSWAVDYPDILHRENVGEAATEWYDEDRVREELDADDTVLRVADADGVVGFGHGVLTRGTGHVLRVYVAPDHRGEGTGRALLGAVEASLREMGAEDLQAMVLADNEAGNAFYRAVGYEPADEDETTIGGETYAETVYRRSD